MTAKPQSEYEHQKSFVAWLRIAHPEYERRTRLSLNGIKIGGKWANIMISMAYKAGMVKGESDLFIAVPIGDKHGIFIEMKKPDGKPTKEQLDYLAEMRRDGYVAEVCESDKEAIALFTNYLKGRYTEHLD